MKKILTLVIAIAMIITLSVCAFAESDTISGEERDQDVSVKVIVQEDAAPEATFFVVVSWEGIDFTYTRSAARDWNTTENQVHGYTSSTSAGWETGTGRATSAEGTITVANHSDVAITVSQSVSKIAGGDDLSVECAFADGSDASVNAAEAGSDWNTYDSAEFKVTVSGTPDFSLTTLTQVATITVTIA